MELRCSSIGCIDVLSSKGWTKSWAGRSFIQHKVNDICIANQSSQGAAVSLGCVK
jgi:hypothetical protein